MLGSASLVVAGSGSCASAMLQPWRMPVNSTHPEYDSNLASWERIRDVLLGDAAIKRGGDKYVPRLDSQSDSEFEAYVERGFFYNASARSFCPIILHSAYFEKHVSGVVPSAKNDLAVRNDAQSRNVDIDRWWNVHDLKLSHEMVLSVRRTGAAVHGQAGARVAVPVLTQNRNRLPGGDQRLALAVEKELHCLAGDTVRDNRRGWLYD